MTKIYIKQIGPHQPYGMIKEIDEIIALELIKTGQWIKLDSSNQYDKKYLEKLSMDELQKIGHKFNVKDNKKEELIPKILEAESKETK